MRFRIIEQPVSAVTDGNGAGRLGSRRCPDAHSGGHGEEHRVPTAFQLRAHFGGRAGAKELAAVHDRDTRRKGERFFQTMFGQEDGRSQFAVDLAKRRKKIRRGNGVELARRLVENQHLRLQDHNGSEIQELLLPTGQLCDRLIKPCLDAEKRCHFRNAAANGRGIIAEGFQPERQLVPDLVGRDLIFRTLLHKADLLGLFALV